MGISIFEKQRKLKGQHSPLYHIEKYTFIIMLHSLNNPKLVLPGLLAHYKNICSILNNLLHNLDR